MVEQTILCIDPGTRHTGIAVFAIDEAREEGRLLKCFAIDVKKSAGDWEVRVEIMLEQVLKSCLLERPDRVFIEQPALFLSTAKGQAASNSGAVLKLVATVYYLAGALRTKGYKVTFVPVRKWKGNVPKTITAKRVLRFWNCRSGNNNITDAVGIGDYHIRKVLKYKPIK